MHSASFGEHVSGKMAAKVRVQAAALVVQIHEALQDRAPETLREVQQHRCTVVCVAGSPHCTVRHDADGSNLLFSCSRQAQRQKGEKCAAGMFLQHSFLYRLQLQYRAFVTC